MASPSNPSWSSVVNNPFASLPARIPDTDTNQSGLVTTKYYTTFSPSANGTSTTTHTGGFLLSPHPNFLFTQLNEATGGSLSMTDFDTTLGTNYVGQFAAPNAAAMSGENVYRVRCVSMGCRVTYEGTELNRAGRFVCGMLPNEVAARGIASTGTLVSLLSTVTGAVPVSYDLLKQSLQNIHVSRMTDSTLEVAWRPFGVPTYCGDDSTGFNLLPRATVSGAALQDSVFGTSVGSNGLSFGSGLLAVFIENDNVSAAALSGNKYGIEVVAHWEVIPKNPYKVAYDLAPSPSDATALSAAMNAISFRPTVLTNRSPSSSPSDRVVQKPRRRIAPPASSTKAKTNARAIEQAQAGVSKKKLDALFMAAMGTYLPAFAAGTSIAAARMKPKLKLKPA